MLRRHKCHSAWGSVVLMAVYGCSSPNTLWEEPTPLVDWCPEHAFFDQQQGEMSVADKAVLKQEASMNRRMDDIQILLQNIILLQILRQERLDMLYPEDGQHQAELIDRMKKRGGGLYFDLAAYSGALNKELELLERIRKSLQSDIEFLSQQQ